MASGLLLLLWTAWLVIALCRLGLKKGGLLVAAFALLGIAVLSADSHAWRPYLMVWLGVHAVVSGYAYLDGFVLEHYRASLTTGVRSAPASESLGGKSPWAIIRPAVSIAGVLWLWIQGGALYWQYFAAAAVAGTGLLAVIWLSRRLWRNYRRRIQQRINAARADLERVIEQRDAQLRQCGDQLQAGHRHSAGLARDLAEARQLIAGLSAECERQRDQIAELQRDVRDLGERERRERERRERERREREERRREAEREQISDIFCCTNCRSIWLITDEGDSRVIRRPAGSGCGFCAGPGGTMRGPSFLIAEHALPIALQRQSNAIAGPSDLTSNVSAPASPPRITLTLRKTQMAGEPHTQIHPEQRIPRGIQLGADLAARDPTALSTDIAAWVNNCAWDGIDKAMPADDCKLLSSIANALDSVPDEIANCVVWCAQVVGAPRIIAEILGALARLTIEAHAAPLHTLAQEIRIVGTVTCAAQGPDHLEHCQCARDLIKAASTGLAADAIKKDFLMPAVDDLRALEQQPATVEPPAQIKPPATDFRAIGGPSALG